MTEIIRVPTTDPLIVTQVLQLTAEVTLAIENSARELTWPRKLGAVFGLSIPLIQHHVTYICVCGNLEEKVCKTNLHTVKEARNIIRRDISTVSGE